MLKITAYKKDAFKGVDLWTESFEAVPDPMIVSWHTDHLFDDVKLQSLRKAEISHVFVRSNNDDDNYTAEDVTTIIEMVKAGYPVTVR